MSPTRLFELPRRAQAVDAALERLGLQARQHQLAGALSGGWKQRLALAACLIHEPKLLLLDEPTAGVDPEARREFWEHLHALAEQGITVLVSTHYMDEAERCHRLAILERGRLVADGTPQDLLASLPGRVWLLRSADTRALEAALRGKPGIIGSAQIGNSLRVLAEPGTDEAALRALLPAPAPESLEAIEPNLEDVFVAATHAARRARGQESR